jgi:hypothetical protein
MDMPSVKFQTQFNHWLDKVMGQEIPKSIIAYNFNLAEPWCIELIGSDTYSKLDEDWACNETFRSNGKPFRFPASEVVNNWKDVLESTIKMIEDYIDAQSPGAKKLSLATAVAVGFVDGNLTQIRNKKRDKVYMNRTPDTASKDLRNLYEPTITNDYVNPENIEPKIVRNDELHHQFVLHFLTVETHKLNLVLIEHKIEDRQKRKSICENYISWLATSIDASCTKENNEVLFTTLAFSKRHFVNSMGKINDIVLPNEDHLMDYRTIGGCIADQYFNELNEEIKTISHEIMG